MTTGMKWILGGGAALLVINEYQKRQRAAAAAATPIVPPGLPAPFRSPLTTLRVNRIAVLPANVGSPLQPLPVSVPLSVTAF